MPGSIFDIVARGAVAGNSSVAAMWQNGAVINATLAALQPHDTLLVPDGVFHTFGGLYAMGLQDATIQIDGTLRFAGGEHRKEWPRDARGRVMECLNIEHSDRRVRRRRGHALLQRRRAFHARVPTCGGRQAVRFG